MLKRLNINYQHSIFSILESGQSGASCYALSCDVHPKIVEQSNLFEFSKENKGSVIISSNLIEISEAHYNYLMDQINKPKPQFIKESWNSEDGQPTRK